jgi:hypothetical protein
MFLSLPFSARFPYGELFNRDRARFDTTGKKLASRRTGFGDPDKRCAVFHYPGLDEPELARSTCTVEACYLA